jgi:hypothetical protein
MPEEGSMRILIDCQGTMLNNPSGATLHECLQSAHDFAESGHEVTLVSGDPEGASDALGGAVVLDKCDTMQSFGGRLRGVMIIDDEGAALAAAVRCGAVAVPAAMLVPMARAMSTAARLREAAGISGPIPRRPDGFSSESLKQMLAFPYPPREITDEVAARIVRESEQVRREFEELTRPMEQIDGADYQRRAK